MKDLLSGVQYLACAIYGLCIITTHHCVTGILNLYFNLTKQCLHFRIHMLEESAVVPCTGGASSGTDSLYRGRQ